MAPTTSTSDYLRVTVIWTALAVGFWIVQDDWGWTLLFPLIGFVWMGAPLVTTRFRPRPLLVTSSTLLIAALTIYLTLVWGALMVLGFFGSLVIDIEQSNRAGVAPALMVEGFKVVPGAVAGAVVGWRLRDRRSPVPME